jgi:hypothetical protein
MRAAVDAAATERKLCCPRDWRVRLRTFLARSEQPAPRNDTLDQIAWKRALIDARDINAQIP